MDKSLPPMPWSVAHKPLYPDELSLPRVVDAHGELIVTMLQNVEHPGLFDPKAQAIAEWIVRSANNYGEVYKARRMLESALRLAGESSTQCTVVSRDWLVEALAHLREI